MLKANLVFGCVPGRLFLCWQMCLCPGLVLRNGFLCSCVSLPQQPALFGASLTTQRTRKGNNAALWNSIVGDTRQTRGTPLPQEACIWPRFISLCTFQGNAPMFSQSQLERRRMRHAENGKWAKMKPVLLFCSLWGWSRSPPTTPIFFSVAGRLTFSTDWSSLFWHHFLCESLVLGSRWATVCWFQTFLGRK